MASGREEVGRLAGDRSFSGAAAALVPAPAGTQPKAVGSVAAVAPPLPPRNPTKALLWLLLLLLPAASPPFAGAAAAPLGGLS